MARVLRGTHCRCPRAKGVQKIYYIEPQCSQGSAIRKQKSSRTRTSKHSGVAIASAGVASTPHRAASCILKLHLRDHGTSNTPFASVAPIDPHPPTYHAPHEALPVKPVPSPTKHPPLLSSAPPLPTTTDLSGTTGNPPACPLPASHQSVSTVSSPLLGRHVCLQSCSQLPLFRSGPPCRG